MPKTINLLTPKRAIAVATSRADDDLENEIAELEKRREKLVRLEALRAQVESLEKGNLSGLECHLTFRIIVEVVIRKFAISYTMLTGSNREERIVIPRHITCYLSRNLTGLSLEAIGKILHRDHGAIRNGVQNVKNRMTIDQKYRILVDELEVKCRQRIALQLNNVETEVKTDDQ